jgi:hypothetical protein
MTPVFYSTNGLLADEPYRFALQADASALSDGRYSWEVRITEHYAGGVTVDRSFTGSRNVRNLTASPIGNRWSLDFVDRLVVESDGVLWVGGEGNLFWFAKLPDGSYQRPAAELRGSTLVENLDGSFTMTGRHGDRSEFDQQGLMTAREDRFGNVTSFSYIDANSNGVADALSEMIDAGGGCACSARTTTLLSAALVAGLIDTSTGQGTQNDPAPLFLTSDVAATRVDPLSNETAVTVDRFGLPISQTDALGYVTLMQRDHEGRVTRLVQPDPDGQGPLPAPETLFAYDSQGNLLEITHSDGSTETWTYEQTFNQATS